MRRLLMPEDFPGFPLRKDYPLRGHGERDAFPQYRHQRGSDPTRPGQVIALPGQCVDHESLANWFWGETMSAEVINTIRKMCLQSDDASLVLLGKLMLVPRNQLHRFEN